MLWATHAVAAKLVWDPSTGDVVGYRVYYGTTSVNYTNNVDVGNVTEYNIDNLPLQEGVTYYFAVKAYNAAGESGFSNAVTWTQGDTTPPNPPRGLNVE
jgi:hypothetical protein